MWEDEGGGRLGTGEGAEGGKVAKALHGQRFTPPHYVVPLKVNLM